MLLCVRPWPFNLGPGPPQPQLREAGSGRCLSLARASAAAGSSHPLWPLSPALACSAQHSLAAPRDPPACFAAALHSTVAPCPSCLGRAAAAERYLGQLRANESLPLVYLGECWQSALLAEPLAWLLLLLLVLLLPCLPFTAASKVVLCQRVWAGLPPAPRFCHLPFLHARLPPTWHRRGDQRQAGGADRDGAVPRHQVGRWGLGLRRAPLSEGGQSSAGDNRLELGVRWFCRRQQGACSLLRLLTAAWPPRHPFPAAAHARRRTSGDGSGHGGLHSLVPTAWPQSLELIARWCCSVELLGLHSLVSSAWPGLLCGSAGACRMLRYSACGAAGVPTHFPWLLPWLLLCRQLCTGEAGTVPTGQGREGDGKPYWFKGRPFYRQARVGGNGVGFSCLAEHMHAAMTDWAARPPGRQHLHLLHYSPRLAEGPVIWSVWLRAQESGCRAKDDEGE